MGVIRNSTSSLTTNESQAEDNHPLEDLLQNAPNNMNQVEANNAANDEATEALNEAEALRSQARQERKALRRLREQKQRKAGARPEPTFRGLGCRGKSYKKHRRYENANLLAHSIAVMALGLDSEDQVNDISIYDFAPQQVSAFAQILMEKENMQAWNDFINHSEEEQKILLDAMDEEEEWGSSGPSTQNQNSRGRQRPAKVLKSRNGSTSSSCSSDSDGFGCPLNAPTGVDKRGKHPAFSGEQCFQRIDGELKALLKKKTPLAILESMEEDVASFFEAQPFSVYQSCLPSGYERLLFHATCQYLDLISKSFNRRGSRVTQVQNPNKKFCKPIMKLACFLENIEAE